LFFPCGYRFEIYAGAAFTHNDERFTPPSAQLFPSDSYAHQTSGPREKQYRQARLNRT